MEYIDGEDLASLLRRIGFRHGQKALDIARQLCGGLAAAHDKGVLHRDLKPANVMIDGQGRVRITDFGLALAGSETEAGDALSGTPLYMAPARPSSVAHIDASILRAPVAQIEQVRPGLRPVFAEAQQPAQRT